MFDSDEEEEEVKETDNVGDCMEERAADVEEVVELSDNDVDASPPISQKRSRDRSPYRITKKFKNLHYDKEDLPTPTKYSPLSKASSIGSRNDHESFSHSPCKLSPSHPTTLPGVVDLTQPSLPAPSDEEELDKQEPPEEESEEEVLVSELALLASRLSAEGAEDQELATCLTCLLSLQVRISC